MTADRGTTRVPGWGTGARTPVDGPCGPGTRWVVTWSKHQGFIEPLGLTASYCLDLSSMEKLRKALLSRWEDRAPWSGTRGMCGAGPGGSVVQDPAVAWSGIRGLSGPGPGDLVVHDPAVAWSRT